MAVEYLVSKGYEIEATKWRVSRYELDIVARKAGMLAFIEVKASRRDLLGPPEIRVGYTKRKRIAEAASEYISQIDNIPEETRFDVIGILWKEGREPRINHIISAFTLNDIES
ncbi:MAG: YraN family protein [candidate division Zixibacteria bacterium]